MILFSVVRFLPPIIIAVTSLAVLLAAPSYCPAEIIEPTAAGYYQPVVVARELFDAGAEIVATAPGDEVPGFRLETFGVPGLETSVTNVVLDDQSDAEIVWSARQSNRIRVVLLVGFHGMPYEAMLLCETDDDGYLAIPKSLSSQLPKTTSNLRQHSSSIARFDRATQDTTAGSIELVVASQVEIAFSRTDSR